MRKSASSPTARLQVAPAGAGVWSSPSVDLARRVVCVATGNGYTEPDVAPDGRRFVMFPAAESSRRGESAHATLVLHWFDELKRTFATSGN